MYAGDFLRLLEKFKHPQWASIGVECTRFGAGPRKEFGLAPMGTAWAAPAAVHYDSRASMWFADNSIVRTWVFAVAKDSMPYLTIRGAVWDENKLRWVDKNNAGMRGEMLRGWKPALEQMLQGGYLRPDPILSNLLGSDSRKLIDPFWRIL